VKKFIINTVKLLVGCVIFVPFLVIASFLLMLQWIDLRYFEPYLKDAQDLTLMGRLANPVLDKLEPFFDWLFVDVPW
jgi:hypothetical protein